MRAQHVHTWRVGEGLVDRRLVARAHMRFVRITTSRDFLTGRFPLRCRVCSGLDRWQPGHTGIIDHGDGCDKGGILGIAKQPLTDPQVQIKIKIMKVYIINYCYVYIYIYFFKKINKLNVR